MPLVSRTSNQGNLYKQALEPSGWLDGDIWSDTTTNSVKNNVGGTATAIGASSFSASATVSYSETIGDYTTPVAAVATSTAASTAAALWGLLSDQTIENFTTYTTQGEADTRNPSSDTAKVRVNITNDNIDMNSVTDGTNDSISQDIGLISDTAWELRFKYTYTSANMNPIGYEQGQFVGMGSTNQTIADDGVQDFIGVLLWHDNIPRGIYGIFADNESCQTNRVNLTTPNITTSSSYWVKILRTSATIMRVFVYSDDTFSTQTHDTGDITIDSTIVNLRYFKIMNESSRVVQSGDMIGTFDDIQLLTSDFSLAQLWDDDTATKWKTTAEANPAVYVDCGSSKNLVGCAIWLDADSTETEITIRCSTDTSFTAAENVRTILATALTAGQWNYIRFNLVTARYMQFYGSSGSSLILGFDEVKYLTKTDTEVLADLGVISIGVNDTSLALDGT